MEDGDNLLNSGKQCFKILKRAGNKYETEECKLFLWMK